jgi:hypothetical protein
MVTMRPPGASARASRAQHVAAFDLRRKPRLIGLRGHNEVEFLRFGAARNDRIEGKSVILAVDHHDGGIHIKRVPRLLAGPGTPPVVEDRLQPVADLRIEFMRGRPLKLDLLPIEVRRRRVARRHVGDLVIIEIGRHEDGARVFMEAVDHFFDR